MSKKNNENAYLKWAALQGYDLTKRQLMVALRGMNAYELSAWAMIGSKSNKDKEIFGIPIPKPKGSLNKRNRH